ncbi:MAG: DUF4136 domain-containing protein [Bacteroidia bacterium]|nr:DUF4136 domain-containing protein [Bacteroidia bacterium]
MKLLKILYLLVAFFFLGCGSTADIKIISDFDDTAEFNEYQTFVICIDDLYVEHSAYPKYDNNNIRQLIGKEIEDQMEGLGYKTNVIAPELQAGFQLLIVQEETTFSNCDLQEDYKYWQTCTIKNVIYTEETLVVYVSDIQKNQVIWQASVSCNLNRPQNVLKSYVMDVVEKLFDNYPKTN